MDNIRETIKGAYFVPHWAVLFVVTLGITLLMFMMLVVSVERTVIATGAQCTAGKLTAGKDQSRPAEKLGMELSCQVGEKTITDTTTNPRTILWAIENRPTTMQCDVYRNRSIGNCKTN